MPPGGGAAAALPHVPAGGGIFCGGVFFALFFGGGWAEACCAGLAGLACGAVLSYLERAEANSFLSTLASAFVLGAASFTLRAFGVPINLEITLAGGIMVLVPGLVFTNFMSNLLTGDMVSGLATFARALLSAAAIALGAGAAMALFQGCGPSRPGSTAAYPPAVACLLAYVACLGFCLPVNAQGLGAVLCGLGGALGWAVYLFFSELGANIF